MTVTAPSASATTIHASTSAQPASTSAPAGGNSANWLTPSGPIELAQNGSGPTFSVELVGSHTVVNGPYANSGTPQGQVRLEAILKVTNLLRDRSEETSWLGEPDGLAFFIDHKVVPGERCASAFQIRYRSQSEISSSVAHFSEGTAGEQVDSAAGSESLEPNANEEILIFSAETVPMAIKPSQVHLAYTSRATGVIQSGGHPQKTFAGVNETHETVLLNRDGIQPKAEAATSPNGSC